MRSEATANDVCVHTFILIAKLVLIYIFFPHSVSTVDKCNGHWIGFDLSEIFADIKIREEDKARNGMAWHRAYSTSVCNTPFDNRSFDSFIHSFIQVGECLHIYC